MIYPALIALFIGNSPSLFDFLGLPPLDSNYISDININVPDIGGILSFFASFSTGLGSGIATIIDFLGDYEFSLMTQIIMVGIIVGPMTAGLVKMYKEISLIPYTTSLRCHNEILNDASYWFYYTTVNAIWGLLAIASIMKIDITKDNQTIVKYHLLASSFLVGASWSTYLLAIKMGMPQQLILASLLLCLLGTAILCLKINNANEHYEWF